MIDDDAFEEWLAHPITELFFKCCGVWAEEAKAQWVSVSWEGGEANAELLARMRERARTLAEVKTVTLEQIKEAIDGTKADSA